MRVCQFRHFGLSLLRTSEYSQKVCLQKSGRLSTPTFIVQTTPLLSNQRSEIQQAGRLLSKKRRRVLLRLANDSIVILY